MELVVTMVLNVVVLGDGVVVKVVEDGDGDDEGGGAGSW